MPSPSSRRPSRRPAPGRRPAAPAKRPRSTPSQPPAPVVPAGPPLLSGNQRRFLRAQGHHLQPIVQVGQHLVTEGVCRALAEQLLAHELVKLKFGQSVEDRLGAVRALARATGSACAQILGRTALFYRPHPTKPRIRLPPGRPDPVDPYGVDAPAEGATSEDDLLDALSEESDELDEGFDDGEE